MYWNRLTFPTPRLNSLVQEYRIHPGICLLNLHIQLLLGSIPYSKGSEIPTNAKGDINNKNSPASFIALKFRIYLTSFFQKPLLDLCLIRCQKRHIVVKINDVSPVAGLGGDFPAQFVLLNFGSRCYDQSSFFSRIHFSFPFTHLSTVSIYYWGLTCQYFWYISLVDTIRIYQWETRNRKYRKLGKSCSKDTGVGAVTNGWDGTMRNRASVRSVRVRIGISPINFEENRM